VLVLDGKSGTPLRDRTVEIYSDEPASEPVVKGPTDQNGFFTVATPLPSEILVHVKGRFLCSGKGIGSSHHRVWDIASTGVEDVNLCNVKISRHAQMGELIVYVRPQSISEFLDL
jgi:hypothetical protein